MQLSKTELKVLKQIAEGKKQASEIALIMNKDRSQIYRILRSLQKKRYTRLEKKRIIPSESTHVRILLQELSRQSSIMNNLSDCGIKFYTAMLEPKSIAEIMRITGIKRSTIFYKLKEASKNSFINISKNKYFFNENIWPGVKEFLIELKKYEEIIDNRIPPSAIIYFKNEKEIIFSTREDFDATLTAFSVYEKYGIKLYNITYYFYLPKKELNKEEVFMHSLYVAEKDLDFRSLMYAALFYAKYRNELSGIKHQILNNFNKIFDGQKIPGYPPLKEIQEKLEIYDIKLPIYN